MDQGRLIEPVWGMGTGRDPLPSEPSQGQEDSVNPVRRVFRQQGGDFSSLPAKCNLASASLAFCDFDGQTVSSENFLAHSFIHIFIYSASAKHCDRTQREHKP